MRRLCLSLTAALAFAGCSDGATDPAPVDATPLVAVDAALAPDTGTAIADDAAATPDADAPDAGHAPDAAEPRPPDVCDSLALPRRAFDDGPSGLAFGDRAGDFTINTLAGDTWNLRDRWTGCESFVFLVYFPGAYGDALFASGVERIVRRSPLNVHYFFASYEASEEARRARIQAVRTRVEDVIVRAFATQEEADAQLRRFHFVIDRATEIAGSVGPFIEDYRQFARTSVVDIGDGRRAPAPPLHVFGIDRGQRWDPGDNLNEYVGGPVLFDMASYLGDFYDYKAALEHRLASESGVVTRTLVDTATTARIFETDVMLPSLAPFDTLEFDVQIVCEARNPFGCSEWDRIANVFACEGADCSTRHEIARWITPYWRRGEQRWVIDASPLIPLLRSGTQRFRVETGPDWERATPYRARVELRLSTRGKPRPIGAVPAFSGGAFDGNYNASRAPVAFTAPAGARRVELVTILSGHGQTQRENCAEWCDHRHRFAIDGVALPVIAPAAGTGTTRGCAERARDGVPPGQWGNWGPQRAYWCPGLPVALATLDLTAHVAPGVTSTLTYSASLGASSPPPGGDIALSSYLVWYE